MELSLSVPTRTPEDSEPSTTASIFKGVQLSTRIMPAEHAARGGDWCETFVVSEDVIALSIGDVCGHGKEKFAAMVAMRQVIHDSACLGLNPALRGRTHYREPSDMRQKTV